MKPKIDFSGVVSVTKIVHGIEVRGLNFADIAAQWNTNAAAMMMGYEAVMEQLNAAKDSDNGLDIVNAIISVAPDLARAAFLAAINDKGETGLVDGVEMTAAEVWDTKMSIGRQADFLIAIFELTMNESDNLKKKLKSLTQMRVGDTAEAKVLAAMSITQ